MDIYFGVYMVLNKKSSYSQSLSKEKWWQQFSLFKGPPDELPKMAALYRDKFVDHTTAKFVIHLLTKHVWKQHKHSQDPNCL